MTTRNTSDEATAGHGLAAARHQLGLGRGSAQPNLRGRARSGACVNFCSRSATGRRICRATAARPGRRRAGRQPRPAGASGRRIVAGRCDQARHFVVSGRVRRAMRRWCSGCPAGTTRIKVQAATDEVSWLCHTPHGHQIDFGRMLWGQANEYPQEILLRDGGKARGPVPSADYVRAGVTAEIQFQPGERITHHEYGQGVVLDPVRDGYLRAFFGIGERRVPARFAAARTYAHRAHPRARRRRRGARPQGMACPTRRTRCR